MIDKLQHAKSNHKKTGMPKQLASDKDQRAGLLQSIRGTIYNIKRNNHQENKHLLNVHTFNEKSQKIKEEAKNETQHQTTAKIQPR